ncbi:MAG: tripartite tricarboxylate transporter substrate binding protein [Alphaproteobacteria bacterium]|nr:tripartite tricarboxylate transporter substrate binding protein [Alphaproteobacteria bacterium]
MLITRRAAIVLAAASLVGSGSVAAQPYPGRPVRIVVPYPPGGPVDVLARIIAQELSGTLGQNFYVENKPGASGALGTRDVARSPADGYSLVLGTNQTHATNASLLKEPGYDPVRDFVSVAGLADLQHVLTVRNDLGVTSLAELIALAKREPGKLNYGSTGNGSASHLAMELFKSITGTQMQHVAFRGAAPLVQEIVAGRIDLSFVTLPSVLGQIQAGQAKALAIASPMRAPQLPEVRLLREQGVANGEADAWVALFAPAATPPDIIARLTGAVTAALAKPEVAANALKQGFVLNVRAPAQFGPFVAAEVAKWAEVVKLANVKAE